jgi:hypothetical protein
VDRYIVAVVWLMGFIGANLFNLELGALAIGMGIWRNSWWVFGVLLIVGYVVQSVKILAIPMALVLSVAWGAGGYWAGSIFERADAQWVIGIIVGFIALGLHCAALNYNGMIDLNN